MKKRLAIVTTHPVQYHAPLFQLLAKRNVIDLHVFYTWQQSQKNVFDKRFGLMRNWDVPLLEGYSYSFEENTGGNGDSNSFMSIVNPRLIQKLRTGNFDAVLVYRWNLFSHLKVLQSFGSKPTLFFRGDSVWNTHDLTIKKFIRQLFLKWVYRNVDKAFYVGAAGKEYFIKAGFKEHQLIKAPHAVDNQRFEDADGNHLRQAINKRRELNINDGDIVFIYAGKFYGIKQVDVLIRAFTGIKADNYKLLLYGSGEEEQQLKNLAKNDVRIFFDSFKNQSEMPIVYRTGNVYVLPSKSETWGLGVNEAMASGLPAIVSDTCGCAHELILDSKTGYIVKSGCVESLQSAMMKMADKRNVSQMGIAAQQHIRQFNFELYAEALEKALG